jgi:sulfatase modifying factor 1
MNRSAPLPTKPIPKGTYQVGNTAGDTDLVDAPVTEVQLSACSVGVNPITLQQWSEVQTWAVANGYPDLVEASGKAPDHPVVNVGWFDVIKWCNAASEMAGLPPCYRLADEVYRTGLHPSVSCYWSADGFRLPTEAEWEVAARGGLIGLRFPWGDSITQSQANYCSTENFPYDFSKDNGFPGGFHPEYGKGDMPYTSPVGTFPENGYGLHDVAGNVLEWCWDWYGPYESGSDPKGAAEGTYRVLRGGLWIGDADMSRCAQRVYDYPVCAANYGHYGFRVARNESGSGKEPLS